MNRFRGTFLVAVIGVGSVVLPAETSEAGLISWLRCVINPCRWPCGSPCAPSCEVPACPPVVQEGSYYNPCPQPCSVSYVRRCYTEARTRMTTQTVLEPRPTYVRRRYWDPCSVCYKTYYEPATSYARRSYCVPVTEYVQRSYLEPVTNCATPSCPTDCPVSTPASTENGAPAATRQMTQPVIGGRSFPVTNPRGSARSMLPPTGPSGRETNRSLPPSAQRLAPLALNSDRPPTY
jgi:hypothetical protein